MRSRCRSTVSEINVAAIAAAATPTPHQTPLMLSSQPIKRSIEKRPGPIAATATATVASESGNSSPPLLLKKPEQGTLRYPLQLRLAARLLLHPCAVPLTARRVLRLPVDRAHVSETLCTTFAQASSTSSRPADSAIARASSETTPSCSHSAF